MFQKFDEESKKVLLCAKKEMQELKHEYIGTEHVMLAMLKNKEICNILNVSYDRYKKEVIKMVGVGKNKNDLFIYTPLLKRVLERTIINAREKGICIHLTDILYSILDEGEGVGIRILLSMNVDIERVYNDLLKNIPKNTKKKSVLAELGVNLNEKAINSSLDPIVGRDNEIKRIIEILCRRTKNNPILIGEAGVGKTAIVEGLAEKIVSGNIPDVLKNKKIISLDMASSVAGTKYRGEFEDRMKNLLLELEENEDIILFIDEIHTIMGAGGAEGAIDASNIFKPALARGKMRLIGSTTNTEYKKFIGSDSALDRRFQKVFINEPDDYTLKEILLNLKEIYEKHHGVIIEDKIIRDIIELSKKYIKNRKEPDKSIDVLDEVCSMVSLKKTNKELELNNLNNDLKKIITNKNRLIANNDFKKAYYYKQKENKIKSKINSLEIVCNDKKVVTKEDIIDVIKSMIDVPILNIDDNYINNIKNKLNKCIVGQENVIEESLSIIKKNNLLGNPTSILFCGSTGVGKTYFTEKLGNLLLGKNVIKLNMSDYSSIDSITKIVGVTPGYIGYSNNYSILDKIKDKPNSVLILDEIEKCNNEVLDIFIRGINDGYVKNSSNEKVDFSNLYILMTTNIDIKNNNIGFSNKKMNIETIIKNRFNNLLNNAKVIMFNSLNQEDITKIIGMKLSNLKNKYNVNLEISDKNIKEICNLSLYENYGAKKIDELINNKFESILLENILENKKDINNVVNS